jgi:hypothetical protein
MKEFKKMPERQPTDKNIGVRDIGNGEYEIECGDQRMVVGEYNLVRIFGVTAILLGIPLSKSVGKNIKL